jgi:hypothetical protein
MSATESIDSIAAPVQATSLDPYGQLIKMLMPRALHIAVYAGDGLALWLSDGVEHPDLQALVNETAALCASGGMTAANAADPAGLVRTWTGDSAYIFVIRDAGQPGGMILGYLAVISPDTQNGARPFSLVQGLLRPALDVLARELANQYNLDDLQRDLAARDGDLQLLLDANIADGRAEADEFDRLVRACAKHLNCVLGALLIPDKSISICASGQGMQPGAGTEILARTHRHLLAWAQVQRRTLVVNRVAANGPLGTVPYKILACPVLQGAQRVIGILLLFKAANGEDFLLRHIRIAEL